MVVLALAFCWALGEFVGARRAYQAEVEQRLALLEVERDHQARMAVAAERARIARELHDVVAHAVSVIVVQADGAAYAVRSQPELAERAVQTISATGREALTELRRLLGVLRSEEAEGELTPQPGTQSLSELAERVRAVGLPVRLEIVGDVDDLPAGRGARHLPDRAGGADELAQARRPRDEGRGAGGAGRRRRCTLDIPTTAGAAPRTRWSGCPAATG